MTDPFIPDMQAVYWVDGTILPANETAGPHRAVVVVGTPPTTTGTVTVVSRSGTERFGVAHPADPSLGLSGPGRFSRRHPVQAQLWTPATTLRAGVLDDATFAAVVARFGS